jgi:hypothetical protein
MEHPYIEFENTNIWNIVEQALDNMIENKDVLLQTQKEYVVGYLCKQLKEKTGE